MSLILKKLLRRWITTIRKSRTQHFTKLLKLEMIWFLQLIWVLNLTHLNSCIWTLLRKNWNSQLNGLSSKFQKPLFRNFRIIINHWIFTSLQNHKARKSKEDPSLPNLQQKMKKICQLTPNEFNTFRKIEQEQNWRTYQWQKKNIWKCKLLKLFKNANSSLKCLRYLSWSLMTNKFFIIHISMLTTRLEKRIIS